MNFGGLDIDMIVREVVRRLMSEIEQPPAPSQASVPHETERIKTNELTFGERLLTVASLKGKLTGVRRVVVPAKCVVTPAAKDELKQNKIELVRQSAGSGSSSAAKQVVLVTAQARGDAAGLLAAAGCASPQRMAFSKLEDAASEMEAAVRRGAMVVLATEAVDLALVLVNRRGELRAVHAHDAKSLPAVIASVKPNVLVFSPQQGPRGEITSILKQYLAS